MIKTSGAEALGTERIRTLLKQYAIPAIIAMTASSLYNIVDSIFIGRGVGPFAISGLALTFPIMNLSTAFGTLVGVGSATLISMKLGEKDYDAAHRVLGNSVVLNIIVGIVITIVVLPFLDVILAYFGGSENTIGYAHEYMEIIIIGNTITHLYFGLNAMLRSTGHPREAMIATITTVVLNTALDALFIFVFDMGIRGVAIATVLSQLILLVGEVAIFCRKNEIVRLKRGIFKIYYAIARRAIQIGTAPFLLHLVSCFIVVLINRGLKEYGGDLAIGAYGIANRLVFIVVMIVLGFNQAMQPIAGYNYGAKQYDRVVRVLKLTCYAATVVTTTGFLVAMIFAEPLVALFTDHDSLQQLSAEGLRLMICMFPIVGAQMVISNFFQCIGKASKAILMSTSRQLLFLVPGLIIFPQFFGTWGVWISMPVSDVISTFVAAMLLVPELKKLRL